MPKEIYIGIDVGALELQVAILSEDNEFKELKVANSAEGHQRLVELVSRFGTVKIGMEATGLYGLDVACALSELEQVQVMMINPRSAKEFHKALMNRSKTDKVDARTLAMFVRRMPFTRWEPPSEQQFELRGIARRIKELKKTLNAEQNRLHAAESTKFTSKVVLKNLKKSVKQIMLLIKELEQGAKKIIAQDPVLKQKALLLESIDGIGTLTAIYLLAELTMLRSDMDVRQLVAYAGLDPVRVQSGSSVDKPSTISKKGNTDLRKALYMPALVAIKRNNIFRAFYLELIRRHKKPKQAIVAVMRKLLHAVFGILKTGTLFDARRLFPEADYLLQRA